MPCYYPLKAYRSQERNPETGRYGVTFNATKALIEGSSLTLPCGRCIGCRLERSRQWALRMEHEAQLYDTNAFVTLTFADDKLPANYSVNVRDTQLFLKRLRKKFAQKIRFYACGEYGDENHRPHYHLILFNHQFADLKLHSRNDRGEPVYISETLTNLWPFGHATTAHVTFETCAYVARYVTKKVTGEQAGANYLRQHPVTKFWHQVEPEFGVMSRRPGLGAHWLDKFRSDVWPSDYIISRGLKMRPPRAYEKALSEEELTAIKRVRAAGQRKNRADNTPARLKVREQVKLSRLSTLKRKL